MNDSSDSMLLTIANHETFHQSMEHLASQPIYDSVLWVRDSSTHSPILRIHSSYKSLLGENFGTILPIIFQRHTIRNFSRRDEGLIGRMIHICNQRSNKQRQDILWSMQLSVNSKKLILCTIVCVWWSHLLSQKTVWLIGGGESNFLHATFSTTIVLWIMGTGNGQRVSVPIRNHSVYSIPSFRVKNSIMKQNLSRNTFQSS